MAVIDQSQVANKDLVGVLLAHVRQQAHQDACWLAAIVEVGCAVPEDPSGASRRSSVSDWAAGEVGAVLTLTSRAADRELQLAEAVTHGFRWCT